MMDTSKLKHFRLFKKEEDGGGGGGGGEVERLRFLKFNWIM